MQQPTITENYQAATSKLANNLSGQQFLAAAESAAIVAHKIYNAVDEVRFVKCACNATPAQAAKLVALEQALKAALAQYNA